MKTSLFSLFVLALVSAVGAQDLTTFGGYHTQLFGYTDERYVGSDQGDYLKTLAWYSGAELVQKGFKTDAPETDHIVMGAAALIYVQNEFDSRNLYGVPSEGIDPEKIPSKEEDKTASFQFIVSAFAGFQDEWWGAEGGLSAFIKGQNESVRQRLDRNGDVVDSDGRGWVFVDGSLVLPNFRLRFGAETLPHFVVSLYRGNYDPAYGALQAQVIVPFSKSFGLTVGGSLFQTSSLYIEPEINWGGVTTSVRAGTILNYNDDAFTRVGIFEGLFLSGSVGVRW